MIDAELTERQKQAAFGWLSFLWSVISIAMVTGAGSLLTAYLSLASIAFLFLLPVVFSAGRDGLWGGLITAGLATASFNFFFVPPTYTLHVASADNIVTLMVFAAVAFAVSSLVERLKLQARAAERTAWESAQLAEMARRFGEMTNQQDLADQIVITLSKCTNSQVQIVTATELRDKGCPLSPMDQAAARWAMAHGSPAGGGSNAIGGADAYYLPLASGERDMAAIQFWRSDSSLPVPVAQQPFIAAIVARGSEALRRAHVLAHQADLDARARHDALREALLASISHDLRTPLTCIRAGLDALDADDADLLENTRREAARLEQMITNLLDLAQVRANARSAERVPIDLTDVIDAALTERDTILKCRPVSVTLDSDLPLVLADARMLHHMLLNLIDNACKYSADGTAISIAASTGDHGVTLALEDHGIGLPDMDTSDLFALFKRGEGADRVPGHGLGLAVVDGFARAMGLGVTARNHASGGARFAIHFPADAVRPIAEECA